MTMLRAMDRTMTCAEFQETLPELFEAHADFSSNEHLKSCENCAALVRDLEYIAAQARLLLPIQDPSPAVWEHIQKAIRQDRNSGASSAPAGRK
ncbi:MAG TPA: hypothetical protein VMD25_00075 [Acidobacteriaceae bacterium]|nr:hypothetical protein [Acidobacteriaceae bacterium]